MFHTIEQLCFFLTPYDEKHTDLFFTATPEWIVRCIVRVLNRGHITANKLCCYLVRQFAYRKNSVGERLKNFYNYEFRWQKKIGWLGFPKVRMIAEVPRPSTLLKIDLGQRMGRMRANWPYFYEAQFFTASAYGCWPPSATLDRQPWSPCF